MTISLFDVKNNDKKKEDNVVILLLGQNDVLVGNLVKETDKTYTLDYPGFLGIYPVDNTDEENKEKSNQVAIQLMRPIPFITSNPLVDQKTIQIPKARTLSKYTADTLIKSQWLKFRAETIKLFAQLMEKQKSLVVDPDTIMKDQPTNDENETVVNDTSLSQETDKSE